jgi:cysteine dioxygenase
MAPSPSSSSSSSAAASDGDTPIYASLDELVATLRAELAVERAAERSPATIARVRALLEQFRFNQEEWQQYASFTSGAYTRNLIGYDEKFTLLLLCWPAGLASAIHDHAEASCWMKILSGRMRETRYAFPGDREPGAVDEELSLAVLKVTELGPEEAAYIDDSRGLHKMGNASPIAPSVSLHIYSPPFARCRVFDEATGATREVSLRGANACANPFMESDLGALALAPLGSTFRVPPSSPDAPPASVAELCARLRATFAAAVPKDVRNEQLCHLLNDARFAKQEWDEYVHFSERRYQRVLLAFDENFSLVLNCWHKQQATPVHRHHGVDAWMRVVAGELTLSHIAASSSSSSSDGATEPLAVQRLEPKHGATFFGAAALGLHQAWRTPATRLAPSRCTSTRRRSSTCALIARTPSRRRCDAAAKSRRCARGLLRQGAAAARHRHAGGARAQRHRRVWQLSVVCQRDQALPHGRGAARRRLVADCAVPLSTGRVDVVHERRSVGAHADRPRQRLCGDHALLAGAADERAAHARRRRLLGQSAARLRRECALRAHRRRTRADRHQVLQGQQCRLCNGSLHNS